MTGWIGLIDKFLTLRNFVGDLASVFPDTSTTESDFSVIGWEKNDFLTDLVDFLLEGIRHRKQYHGIKQLSRKINT